MSAMKSTAAAGADDAFVVERASLELERWFAKLRAQPQGAHELGRLAAGVEHADVRGKD